MRFPSHLDNFLGEISDFYGEIAEVVTMRLPEDLQSQLGSFLREMDDFYEEIVEIVRTLPRLLRGDYLIIVWSNLINAGCKSLPLILLLLTLLIGPNGP